METAQAIMESLNQTFGFVNTNTFYIIFTISAMVNPVAVTLQAIKAWRAQSVESLSFGYFMLMLYLQSLTVLYGVMVKEPAITLVMLLSTIGTITILSAIVYRRVLT